jgi:hypothetical protein
LPVPTAFPDEASLHDFVTRSAWLRDVASVDVSTVLGSLGRGGMLAPWLRDRRGRRPLTPRRPAPLPPRSSVPSPPPPPRP